MRGPPRIPSSTGPKGFDEGVSKLRLGRPPRLLIKDAHGSAQGERVQ